MTGADTFMYRGHELTYLDHSYNATRLNERAVEVPIADAWLAQLASATWAVEVGNVLAYYGLHPNSWFCVDRDEVAPGVVNADIREWDNVARLNAVISISTFEHVGQDEGRWEDAWPAIERVTSMLAPDGSMLVTIGLGQNPALDEVLLGGATSAATADTLVAMQHAEHASGQRAWYETLEPEFRPYVGHSGMGAGAVWIGQFGRPVL